MWFLVWHFPSGGLLLKTDDVKCSKMLQTENYEKSTNLTPTPPLSVLVMIETRHFPGMSSGSSCNHDPGGKRRTLPTWAVSVIGPYQMPASVSAAALMTCSEDRVTTRRTPRRCVR